MWLKDSQNLGLPIHLEYYTRRDEIKFGEHVDMSEHLTELTDLLRNLQAQNHEIEGATVVSVQGLPIVTSSGWPCKSPLMKALSPR